MDFNKLVMRQECPGDYQICEELTREAFWNRYQPGCDEHYLLHTMRNADSFIPELDIVAEYEERIIGQILYTKSEIIGDNGKTYPTISFGPISVHPEFQSLGIGMKMIAYTRDLAKNMGYKAILITGDPDYYSRSGFVAAEILDIRTSEDNYLPALQAFELEEGFLKECAGHFYEDEIFVIDAKKAEAFDQNYPPKEKISGLPSQLRFLEIAASQRPRNIKI